MKKLVIVAITMLFFSCSKNDDTPAQTKKDLITRNWKQTDALASLGGGIQTSIFNTLLQPCQRDNIWQFRSDGTYSVSEGATRCDGNPTDLIFSSTWSLSDNDTKLIMTDPLQTNQTYTIVELTVSSMKLSGVVNYQGASVNVTTVFTAF